MTIVYIHFLLRQSMQIKLYWFPWKKCLKKIRNKVMAQANPHSNSKEYETVKIRSFCNAKTS